MSDLNKRKPEIQLPLSVRFAREYLEILTDIQKKHTIHKIQESNEITAINRALWTSLIIEIGRIFDTYTGKNKEVISYKKIDTLKIPIDKLHGELIIGKILQTRNTFTAHWSQKKSIPVTVEEICNSNLADILDKLNKLPINNNV